MGGEKTKTEQLGHLTSYDFVREHMDPVRHQRIIERCLAADHPAEIEFTPRMVDPSTT